MAELTYKQLSFDDLRGWADDDLRAALDVFCKSCGDAALADLATTTPVARGFFEDHFQPVLIEDGTRMVFTGYFEPQLQAALVPSDDFAYPIYSVPDDMDPNQPYLTRRQIEEHNALGSRDLEIAWLRDPVDAFFLQVQGSGRLCLPDGSVMRVGYAAKNGHPYVSVGKVLVERGVFSAATVSADAIRAWVRDNGTAGRSLLWENPSFVFFRQINEVPADQGPLGAMNIAVTPLRSIAVDPDVVTLGLPVWIEKAGDQPMHRLMIAQDTGSAIRGAQRADIFFGTGDSAGKQASAVKDAGRMVVLMPNAVAQEITGGGQYA